MLPAGGSGVTYRRRAVNVRCGRYLVDARSGFRAGCGQPLSAFRERPWELKIVKALVRWANGKRLTNRPPKLILITLFPPLNSGILGLRMGPYVPTPKFFYNLWGPREHDSSVS